MGELEISDKSTPDNAVVESMLARCYANLDEKDDAVKNIDAAEAHIEGIPSKQRSDVYVSTGEAFSTLGDQASAMARFRKALEVPDSDRIRARLAIAEIMSEQGRFEDANRQIALGWMEAAAGDTATPTGTEFLAAADVFRSTHEYELSQN